MAGLGLALALAGLVTGAELQIGFMAPYDDCPACLAAFVSTVKMLNDTGAVAPHTVTGSYRDSSNRTGTQSLARAVNATVTVDHPAVPLRLLEGPLPPNVLAAG